MAHNSGYTKVWDPAGTAEGLGIHEVARCLGTSKRDIGGLCTSSLINKWAKYKPQAAANMVNKYRVLTLAERQDDNYGFDTASFFSANSADELFTIAETHNFDWAYKARQAPYRLLDFSAVNAGSSVDGYCSDAVAPFIADGDVSGESAPLVQSLTCQCNSAAEIWPKDLGVITEEEDDWYVALFTKHNAVVEYMRSSVRLDNFHSGGTTQVTVSSAYQLGSTITFWGAVNADESKFILLPGTKAVVRVETPVTNRIWIKPRSVHPSYEWDGSTENDVTEVTCHLVVSNNSNSAGTYNFSVNLYVWDSSQEEYVNAGTASTGTVAAAASSETGRDVTVDLSLPSGSEIALEDLYIEASYGWSLNGTTGTYYMDCVDPSIAPSTTPIGKQKFTDCDMAKEE